MKKSRTYTIADEFLRGAAEAGAQVEHILLQKKKIKPCLGCFNCLIKTPGICIHKDDQGELIKKFMASDVAIFASPLYADNFSGQTKTFIDRLIPILDPHLEKDENGEVRHVKKHDKYPLLGVISNCGFPEQSQFPALKIIIRRMARNLDTEVAMEIYRGGGPLLDAVDTPLKPVIDGYKNLLRKAGAEVAVNSKISESTAAELEKPLVPVDMYIATANSWWDEQIKEARKA